MIRDAALREQVTLYATHYATDADPGFGSGSGSGSGDIPTTSDYGDPILVEGVGVTVSASVKPIKEQENLNAQDRVTSFYRVLVRPDVADMLTLDTLSRVVYLGQDYDVLGEVQPFPYRNGIHHLTFLIRRFEGA